MYRECTIAPSSGGYDMRPIDSWYICFKIMDMHTSCMKWNLKALHEVPLRGCALTLQTVFSNQLWGLWSFNGLLVVCWIKRLCVILGLYILCDCLYPYLVIHYSVTGTYLSSLPSDNEELLSTYTPSFLMSHDPANTHHTAHHSSSYHSSSSSNNLNINQATYPLTIVLYVLCDSLLLSSSNKNEQSQEERLRSFHILHALSEMLMDEGIPDFIRSKLLLQLVDPKELLGPSSGRCGQLRSLAFSVYSRCRPAFSHLDRARTLTSFGPTAERESKRV